MRKRELIPLVVLLASQGLLLVFFLAPPGSTARAVAPTGGPVRWRVKALPRTPDGDFNVSFSLSGRAEGVARVLFDLRGDEGRQVYRFLELSGEDGLQFGRSAFGVETTLARRTMPVKNLSGGNLVLRRRADVVDFLADGEIVLRACDPATEGGAVAVGAHDGLEIVGPRLQPIEAVYFADDFMRADKETGDWQTVAGDWSVSDKPNPIRSSNPFNFFGKGMPFAGATIGHPFWSDYRFAVACGTRQAEAIGIYFCYRDAKNYFLFRWTSRLQAAPVRELIACRDGRRQVMMREQGGFVPGQWYTLRAFVRGGTGAVGIDDTRVFTFESPRLSEGMVGLYVEGEKGAQFDDVTVRSSRDVANALAPTVRGHWSEARGSWWFGSDAEGRTIYHVGGGGRSLFPAGNAAHIRLTAGVRPWESGAVGVLLAYQSAADHVAFEIEKADRSMARFWRVAGGERRCLAETEIALDDAGAVLAVTMREGRLTADVNGDRVLEAADGSLPHGDVGLYARDLGSAAFADVSLAFLPPRRRIQTIQETFEHEKTMALWASGLSDWVFRPAWASSGERMRDWWHRKSFRGDAKLELKVPPTSADDWLAAVYVGADSEKPEQGYAFQVRALHENEQPVLRFELRRLGRIVAEGTHRGGAGVRTLALRRFGEAVVGELDGEPVLAWRDPTPLRGARVGWGSCLGKAASGIPDDRAAEWQQPVIYTDNLLNYTFARAPADWRVASGIWEVTNRWECDPRWSFFSGRSDKGAVIWNKRILRGDVTLDFYVGPKMDRSRGRKYEYARDFNAILCGNGAGADSGYAFVFGGNHNTVTRIYRNGLVVAETSKVLIQSDGSLHRRWYHLRVEKRGHGVSLHIDGNEVLRYDDPQPLPDGQAAIWTFDGGIMVARVSLAADEIGPRESPDAAAPEVCRTVYEK